MSFQRLRRIRQLGLSDLVYPSATHTRFTHSIGVYHIARQLVEVIQRDLPSEFCWEKARVALLAALLHDIGHGPFSHVFEDLFDLDKLHLSEKERTDSDLTSFATNKHEKFEGFHSHEKRSAEIIKDKKTQVHQVLHKYGTSLPELVAKTITAEPTDIYARIVSSEFDADRLDYLQRDRMMTGVECGHIDFPWLLDSLIVEYAAIDGDPRDANKTAPCLCLTSKGQTVVEEYLEARSRLWKAVYFHKSTKAAEAMLRRFFLFAAKDLDRRTTLVKNNPVLQYLTNGKPSLSIFCRLDDAQVWMALETLVSDKDKTKKYPTHILELARRLLDRDLYKVASIEGRNALQRFQEIYNEFIDSCSEDVLVIQERLSLSQPRFP